MLLLLQVVYVHIGRYAIEHAYSCQNDYLSMAEGYGSDVT